jgi:tellurite resistance protein TerC
LPNRSEISIFVSFPILTSHHVSSNVTSEEFSEIHRPTRFPGSGSLFDDTQFFPSQPPFEGGKISRRGRYADNLSTIGVLVHHDPIWWVGFNLLVVGLLALDLGVFHRDAHEVQPMEAAIWSAVWVTLSLLFAGFVYLEFGYQSFEDFLTGYIIEKSLSVDNLFVFVLIFTYFKVPARFQHRILFWGILGALVMRSSLILLGAFLLERFHWIIYVFGGFLVITGLRMGFGAGHDVDVEHNPLIRLVRKKFPVTSQYHGQKFFIKKDGQTWVTPMLIVLLLIESTDLIFALDSIPAIFAITDDTFIVYTSNVFAILGLRALYFLLADVVTRFYALRYGLALILVYIVLTVLALSIGVSLLFPKKDQMIERAEQQGGLGKIDSEEEDRSGKTGTGA